MESENTNMYTPAVSPFREMGAYEALWTQKSASFKTIAEMLSAPGAELPSKHVQSSVIDNFAKLALDIIKAAGIRRFGVRIRGSAEYPKGLGDAAYPLALFYFRGWWEHLHCKSIAVVGTRSPSAAAVSATQRLVRELVQLHSVTIVSGLAKGVDKIAHLSAIECGGRTVAVLGTPIHEAFPNENRGLFDIIAKEHLVVSQVPIYRWVSTPFPARKFFFPERNVTMSALTSATVIMEAGETSGTLIQAKAALAQGRKLFLFENCFTDRSLEWPKRFLDKGAIRIGSAAEMMEHLPDAVTN